jgi:hypothetical protein
MEQFIYFKMQSQAVIEFAFTAVLSKNVKIRLFKLLLVTLVGSIVDEIQLTHRHTHTQQTVNRHKAKEKKKNALNHVPICKKKERGKLLD